MDNRTAYTLGWLYGRIYVKIPENQRPGPGAIAFAHQCPFLVLGQLHTLAVRYSPPGSVLGDEEITAAFNDLPPEIEHQPKGTEWEAYWAKGYYAGKSGNPFAPPNFDIRVLRKAKKLSQDELAAIIGVSREQISRWETGSNKPTSENIEKLKAALL